MGNQGCKDGYQIKILAYLKENTNSKNKASIKKIRDAIYQEQNGYDPLEKERDKIFEREKGEKNTDLDDYKKKKKMYDRSTFRTIKENVVKLYQEGLIVVEDSNETGYVKKNCKECIYYKQPISVERFPLLIENTIGMANIRDEEKYGMIKEIVESVGKGNAKKYWMHIERTSPEYAVIKRSVTGELKKRTEKVFEGDRVRRAKSCDWVSLGDNLQNLFKAMDEMSGEFCHKISFKIDKLQFGWKARTDK